MNRSPAPWLTSAGFSRQFASATLRRQRERVRFASLSQFSLSYADGTRLSGFVCNDYVQVSVSARCSWRVSRRPESFAAQLGEYYAKTDYGCITQCNSPDFNGVDGIVGASSLHPV